mgnify:CR=1 FL=1
MKKTFTFFIFTFYLAISFSQLQYEENRYREAIFNQVTVQNNVQYGNAPQWVWPYWTENLIMDVYSPTGDVINKRPLIIFTHAGGFLNGSRGVDNMVAICDSFARKGYVTATLDYRKGFNPLDTESAERAVYRGIQDGKAAVRYFKQNALLYGIDTNYVYFGGMSAGGFIALHVGYMDLESERPASTYGGGTVNNLGCLDCAGNNSTKSSKVRAILNYWGAIQDTTNIVAGDIPILNMHGTDDPTVPFEYGQPFGLFTLPYVYGSRPIHHRMQNLGIYSEFYTSNRAGAHMLDGSDNGTFSGSSPNSFWYDTLLPRTTDFLVKMTKSTPTKVSPDTIRICNGTVASFEVNGSPISYYRWYYDNSSVSSSVNTNSRVLSLNFNTSGSYNVGVVEFNEVFCSSDTLWFHVIQHPPVTPDFNHTIANYTNVTFTNNSSIITSNTWDFGDGTTSTDINPQHNYTQNGTYNVTLSVVDNSGCTGTITKQVVIQHLSINDIDKFNVEVYPNPFEDAIQIANSENEQLSFEVVDVTGKIVLSDRNIEPNSIVLIHTSEWNNGLYFVNIYNSKGEVSVVKVNK